MAAAPQLQTAAATEPPAPPPPHAKPDTLGKAAARLAAHLSPVGKAEAATLPAAIGERWSIQLGAFRAPGAAEKAVREAAALTVAKGKPMQIVDPGRAGRDGLYRARLLNFTPAEAQSACAQLHKKRLDCTVLPPMSAKVAAR
jgi:hypothetical protein